MNFRLLCTLIFFTMLVNSGLSQSIELRDIALINVHFCKKLNPNSFQFAYNLSKNRVGKQDQTLARFRLLRFDTLLNIQDTLLMKLPRGFNYLYCQNLDQSVHLLFAYKNGLELCAYNKERRNQKITPLDIEYKKRKNSFEFQSVGDVSGLYVNHMVSNGNWELTKFDWSGQKLWSKNTLRDEKKFIQSIVPFYSNILCLQIEKHKRSTLLRSTVVDASTGKDLSTTDFQRQKEVRAFDNLFTTKDSCLLITGRSFSGKVSQSQVGKPFILKYHPDGKSEELDFIFPATTHTKFMWIDLVHDSHGVDYLIGETFTSGTLAGYIAKEILALPLLLLDASSSSTNSLVDFTKIHFRDVVYLPLIADSTPSTRFLSLHSSTYKIRGFRHTFPLARQAIDMGQSRYLISSQNGIFFQDSHQVRKLELPNNRFMTTEQSVSKNSIFVSENYTIDGSPVFLKSTYLFDIKKNERK